MDSRNIAIGGRDSGNPDYHYRFTCSICHARLTKIVYYCKDDNELFLKCKRNHECVKKEVDEEYYEQVKTCMEKDIYQPK